MEQKRITIKDVARLAETSVATVSNVINNKGRVSQATEKKIRDVIAQVEFSPSAAARNLRDQRSSLIAVIVPYVETGKLMDNPFYWQLVAGIEKGARSKRLHTILIGVERDESFAFVRERHIDGLIVIGALKDDELLQRLKNLKVPVVFVDSYINDSHQINLDDEQGGYIGTKHLIALGHRNIALLSGTLQEQGVHYYRWLGYCRALEESGIEYREELVLQEPVSALAGYVTAPRFGSKGLEASAVFCLSDVTAIGLLKGLHDIGISVPDDLSIVGFDNSMQAGYSIPALTTIHQDIAQKGQQAMNRLSMLMDKKPIEQQSVVLGVELVVRQSTATLK